MRRILNIAVITAVGIDRHFDDADTFELKHTIKT
jgi:hypothetical protein